MRVSIGIIEGKEIKLYCPWYKDFNCGHMDKFVRDSEHHKVQCPRDDSLCCCHCEEHFACFVHRRFGCTAADVAKMEVWDKEGGMMWVNNNMNNHCPIHGHS